MLAVGIVRGKPGVHAFELPVPKVRQPDEVLVRVKEVGLDGTDYGLVSSPGDSIAPERNEMALGHEMSGVVEAVGNAVKSVAPGDTVTLTVRRGCGLCAPCQHNESDMCLTGLYAERGILKLDGYLTKYVVDREQYAVKVPPPLSPIAVLIEPLSIVEKAIEQLRTIQSRLIWTCPDAEHSFLSERWGGCKTALVLGQGPLGLLGAALLRLADIRTFASDIIAEDSARLRLSKRLGVIYIDARDRSPDEVAALCCESSGILDIILEASGAAETAIELIKYMSRSSIYVMTGIPHGDLDVKIDAAQLVRQLVQYNQVIVGSVNSNRRHFEMALRDIERIDTRFDHLPADMLTHRFRLEDYEKAFRLDDPRHVKTVIEVEAWE